MTPRERVIQALEGKQVKGRVPHFELVFFLTMEAFGKVHVNQRNFSQWDQMSEIERNIHRNDIADLYIATARKYEHDAIFIHPNPDKIDEIAGMINLVREKSGDEFFLMMHGDATFGIPNGDEMLDFTYRMVDDPDGLKAEAQQRLEHEIDKVTKIKEKSGLDGIVMCCDYCMNNGPFLSPDQFSEFIAPYLKAQIAAYREMGLYTIKHSDGNIMPIIDQIVNCKPHALHSLDPQGHVDIAEVKRLYGDRVCLIGNVNCSAMDTGTDEDVIESVRYCLKHGMPGGGYIFSTSNCIYTGMNLKRYELMQDIWRKEGNYED